MQLKAAYLDFGRHWEAVLEAAFSHLCEAIFLQLEATFEIAVAIEAAFSAFEAVFLRQSLEADYSDID